MDRVQFQRKRRKAVLKGVHSWLFGVTLLMVFAIVGGLEAGTITLGLGLWLLGLCMAALWALVCAMQ